MVVTFRSGEETCEENNCSVLVLNFVIDTTCMLHLFCVAKILHFEIGIKNPKVMNCLHHLTKYTYRLFLQSYLYGEGPLHFVQHKSKYT